MTWRAVSECHVIKRSTFLFMFILLHLAAVHYSSEIFTTKRVSIFGLHVSWYLMRTYCIARYSLFVWDLNNCGFSSKAMYRFYQNNTPVIMTQSKCLFQISNYPYRYIVSKTIRSKNLQIVVKCWSKFCCAKKNSNSRQNYEMSICVLMLANASDSLLMLENMKTPRKAAPEKMQTIAMEVRWW